MTPRLWREVLAIYNGHHRALLDALAHDPASATLKAQLEDLELEGRDMGIRLTRAPLPHRGPRHDIL